ncbi:TolC family protein [Cytophagaceae bacterium YF14B1]|uniref:TolC family protein n=1 Tax=Xanthocytophaga flava TaxID=3048013 RepID=A0AAE3QZ85_9BACT|nr:TolC family protein [Xanthocytophaga flavus]MDJ1485875.1 TolC family protein [Xanthocytophaga flavus]
MNSTPKKRFFHAAGCQLLILVGLVTSQPMWAQTADSVAYFSIKDCIEYASNKNSNIRLARFDERIALAQVSEVKGGALPQININGSLEDRLKIPVQLIPKAFTGDTSGGFIPVQFGTKYTASLTGEITQAIINPSLWIGLKAAKSSRKFYEQTTQRVSEQTAYSIANAYYQIIVAQKRLLLLESNLASTQKLLTNTELQLQNGVAKRVDVNRLKVNANNLQSQIKQAQLSLEQAFNNLKFQMGMSLENRIALIDTALTFKQEDAITEESGGNFFENRIDYKILETNLELQDLDRRNQRSGYYPTLSAYGNYSYQAQRQTFNFFEGGQPWFQSSAIGLRLNIPIFDGLQRNARVQQARLNVEKVKENMNLTKLTVSREVNNAVTQYRNTLQRIGSEQQNVQLAQEVYGVTQLEFREGVSTSSDVVNAETSLREAQNNYITTLLDLYIARLDLERAKGNILPYLNSAK